ncbi:hypothetical protein [Pseudoflavonifractor phocaeensis]|uniref:hypothetical protein n=1 Tax=Pseudoflavonifractor phocaeensis TaxID=1870988 RepID=UPI00195D9424|nr:hypothetical protein [Pseudoflavonifractor phocaeensis]MBM6870290.1 hypothetical protein [Pseudoflavonifractor phocaeensis]
MDYAIAVGYPLCLDGRGESPAALLETGGREVTLSPQQLTVWSSLFSLRPLTPPEEAFAHELAALELAVLGECPSALLEALSPYRPVRQGFCEDGPAGPRAVLGGQRWQLTPMQLRLWRAADGRHTVEQLRAGLLPAPVSEEDAALCLENLLGLLAAELCYLH